MTRFAVALVAACLLSTPTGAFARTDLISAALANGAGGFVCSCASLLDETVPIAFSLRSNNASTVCAVTIAPGFAQQCKVTSTVPRTCKVSREDGGSLNPKKFPCTLSAIDAAGNPTTTIPVDLKVND